MEVKKFVLLAAFDEIDCIESKIIPPIAYIYECDGHH